MSNLKLRLERGKVIVIDGNVKMIYPSMREALAYIFYIMFIFKVKGIPIGYHNDTLYPVHSLLPPVVEKTAKFFDLGVEIC